MTFFYLNLKWNTSPVASEPLHFQTHFEFFVINHLWDNKPGLKVEGHLANWLIQTGSYHHPRLLLLDNSSMHVHMHSERFLK